MEEKFPPILIKKRFLGNVLSKKVRNLTYKNKKQLLNKIEIIEIWKVG